MLNELEICMTYCLWTQAVLRAGTPSIFFLFSFLGFMHTALSTPLPISSYSCSYIQRSIFVEIHLLECVVNQRTLCPRINVYCTVWRWEVIVGSFYTFLNWKGMRIFSFTAFIIYALSQSCRILLSKHRRNLWALHQSPLNRISLLCSNKCQVTFTEVSKSTDVWKNPMRLASETKSRTFYEKVVYIDLRCNNHK